MRKQFLVVLVAVMMGFLILSPNTTNATPFTLTGSDSGGEVSATMDVTFSDYIITVVLDNTSPIELMSGYTNTDDDETNWNSPGITEFGFNVDPHILSSNVSSWNLMANNNVKNISSYWDLDFDSGSGSIVLNFFADTLNGAHGALYNPDAESDYFGADPFLTQATLKITLARQLLPGSTAYDPYMKFQNVGVDGKGSEKTSVPDASIMFLLGSSLIVLGLFGRRKTRRE